MMSFYGINKFFVTLNRSEVQSDVYSRTFSCTAVFAGSEDARESELQIKRIGHLLLRVTPLVEPWAPWGVVLGFQGFRVPPQKMMRRALSLLRGKTDLIIMVGGVHKEFCKARLLWRYAALPERQTSSQSEYVEWWPHGINAEEIPSATLGCPDK